MSEQGTPIEGLQNVDLNELAKNGTELTSPTPQDQPSAPDVGGGLIIETSKLQDPIIPEKPQVQDDDYLLMPSKDGLVSVSASDMNKILDDQTEGEKPATANAHKPGAHIENYVQEMDQLIKAVGKTAVENGFDPEKAAAEREEKDRREAEAYARRNGSTALVQNEADTIVAENNNEKTTKADVDATIDEKFAEAIVIIDKANMGVVEFTPEEREKMEIVKKLKVHEIESVDLKTIKSKKPKRNSLKKILERQPTVHEANVVLPASGYTAVVRGCSTYELIAMMGGQGNALIEAERKWTTLYNKIVSTSIGKMTFNDFLKSTAAADSQTLIYALLTATYPDDDTIPINCPDCGKPIEHHYSVRELLRAEDMSDKLRETVKRIIDHSHTAEDATKVHNESMINQVKTIRLPATEYVAELYIQSAYDLLYTTIKGLLDNKDDMKAQASMLSTTVKTFYVPDPEDPDGGYFEYSEAQDITDIIYALPTRDIQILTHQSEELLLDSTFDYGLMNVDCPQCKHHSDTVPFDLEQILFYRYQQEMSTGVE